MKYLLKLLIVDSSVEGLNIGTNISTVHDFTGYINLVMYMLHIVVRFN